MVLCLFILKLSLLINEMHKELLRYFGAQQKLRLTAVW